MAPQKELTDYERRRLENIRRNSEMIAALNLQAKATELSSASKRPRVVSTKSYKVSPEKKQKSQTPVVIRRSLRTRGMPPEHAQGLDDDLNESSNVLSPLSNESSPKKPSPRVQGPISMVDAYSGEGSFRRLLDTVLSISKKHEMGLLNKKEIDVLAVDKNDNVGVDALKGVVKKEYLDCGVKKEERGSENALKGVVKKEYLDCGVKKEERGSESCVDVWSMKLEEENIARIMPGRIMVVKFFPCNDVRMIVAGNKFGNVTFWNVDHGEQEDNGIYMYRPNNGPVSGIVFEQSCPSKIYTSCYDGFLRQMDAEKEVFDLVYSSDETIFSLAQKPSEMKSLYMGEGRGDLSVWDGREGKFSFQWTLHEDRINTIDFNPSNPNVMLTSSSDGTACLWDLRSTKAEKPAKLKVVTHNRAVHSAYFSPSGSSIATTSFDDRVGILSGINFDDTAMIYHYNQTGRWISSFRGVWGWDDSYVFIGNMKRGVDVISTAQRTTITTLQSPLMSAIPCRFAAHPYRQGMLASATSGGQVYIWTNSS